MNDFDFPHLRAVLEEYGKMAEAYYRDSLIAKKKNASYRLMSSVHYSTTFEGNTFAVSLELLEYWKFIEYGRKPGRYPPPEAIIEWIKVKPITPRPSADGRLPSVKSLAFLIGRKIYREGIAPVPAMAEAIDKVNAEMEARIQEAIDKDMAEIVKYFQTSFAFTTLTE